MNLRSPLIAGLTLALLGTLGAQAKKQPPERGMLVKMESMECGVHQGGLAGLGGFWASIGVTKINSQDKLCPQYLVRTDTMEYHIRPLDRKHPVVLPVGHEALFRIHKDRMFLRVEDLDKSVRQYQVVAEKPLSEGLPNQDTGDRAEP
jgi:hypothetical protein